MTFQWVPTMSRLNYVMENVIHIIHIQVYMMLAKRHLLLRKRNRFSFD